MQVLMVANSDLACPGNIAQRTYYPAKLLNSTVICRDYKKGIDVPVKASIPFGNLIPKILTFISMKIWSNFDNRKYQIKLFEFFNLKHIKNADILHSWEYSPKILKKAKEKNMITILDVPIAHPQFYIDLKNKYNIITDKDEKLDENLTKSLEYADYLIVPSEFVKKTMISYTSFKPDNIYIVPFGVDAEKFKPPVKKKLDKFRVLFAGNINYRKGIAYLLQAWKELDLKEAELVLCGHRYKSTKKLFKNVKNCVIKGFVDMPKEYQSASIFVLPTLLEGSAKVVYEAMASGLPVITTYNAGSIVRHGVDGFIVPIMDVEAIKTYIMYFYEYREVIDKFGKRAREQALNYSWQRYAETLVKIYKEVWNYEHSVCKSDFANA